MTRKLIGSAPAPADVSTVNYPVWMDAAQLESVRRAFQASDDDWAEWSAKAYARLMQEEQDELKSLLTGMVRSGRVGKVTLPCRIRTSVLDQARETAKKYNCTVQALLSTAFYMHALAPSLATDNE